MSAKILVVEDDDAFRESVGMILQSAGYDIVYAATGLEAEPAFHRHSPDLILLDSMLPGKSGVEICKSIRSESMVPIIMLTAKTEEGDELEGLEAGADDYLPKPTSREKLLARIQVPLRGLKERQHTVLKIGDVEIDAQSHEVRKGSRKISLTPLEFKLLATLAKNPNEVFSREMLLEQVWEYTYKADTRLVNVHIQRLRSKIEDDQENPQLVLTVRGWGYKAGPE